MLAGIVVATCLLSTAPAFAQDPPDPQPTGVTVIDDDAAAQPESGIVRDDDTSADVRRIRRDLLIIAGLTTAALAVYVWHTSPTRRVRVASRRAELVLGDLDGPDDGGQPGPD